MGYVRGTILTHAALAAAVVLGAGDHADAQYPGPHCSWSDKTIEVYFNPGSIAATGFDTSHFRDELRDAMATWNEEAQGQYDLSYAGETTATTYIPGAVVFDHQPVWFCSENTSGKAFGATSGNCDGPGALIIMVMEDSCNPGSPRKWRTGWPGSTFDAWGLSGAMSYEGVATHELGHVLGLPDAVEGGIGIMSYTYWHTADWHLYPIDRDSIRLLGGSALRRAVTSTSTWGSVWSSTSQISALRTTFPPGIDGNRAGSAGLTSASYVSFTDVVDVKSGGHGSWSAWPAASTAYDVHQWASIANAPSGQSIVVWPDDCAQTASGCNIDWAWTNSSGSPWVRGTLTAADTFSKAFVEYDASRGRFVLAYLDAGTSRIHTRSAVATSPPSWSSSTTLGTERYRYLGGMVFDSVGAGLLVAASNDAATKGRIRQLGLGGSGSSYTLNGTSWLTSSSELARTRRPFGIAHDASSNRTVFAWMDAGLSRSMAACSKSGVSPLTPCASLTFPFTDIMNGVDVAFDNSTSQFVAGFTSP